MSGQANSLSEYYYYYYWDSLHPGHLGIMRHLRSYRLTRLSKWAGKRYDRVSHIEVYAYTSIWASGTCTTSHQ